MKRILITSALPYANGPLHIGHLAGCYLPADIYFKYQKIKQRDVIHICGTDEHGVLISLQALKEKTTPKKVVDKYHSSIKESLDKLGIEYTNFSRTSKSLHIKTAQEFFLNLYQKDYFTPKTSEELYCNHCKRWLPERFVEGICPYCSYQGARGDQCEKCGRWLEPTMLKEPKCQICGTTPVTRSTRHWFLRLDLLQPEIEKWLKAREGWKENVLGFVQTWLREGLQPRPVTRDIDWGVPVPLPEATNKVIYVWFEALIGYISSTIEWSQERWKDYWMVNDTQLVHFIGKDNIVFHAIVWPGMLIGHGDFILPTQIPANEFLNLEGKKLSTSRNWAVWIPDYLENFEPDSLRYVLTTNAPEKGDVDFTWDDFLAKNNNELSDILGNFVHRTLGFITKYLNGKIPSPSKSVGLRFIGADNELLHKIELTGDEVSRAIESFEFKKALKEIMTLVKEGNRYFDYNKPWEMNERTSTVIYVCATLIANLSILLYPFLPFTAKFIRETLKLDDVGQGFSLAKLTWDEIGKFKLPEGATIGTPKILFPKIDKSKIATEKQKLQISDYVGANQCVRPKEQGFSLAKTQEIISYEDFQKLDLRIAEIKEAHKIEGTQKLIKLKISIGDEIRQIIAGIGATYLPQELIGEKIVVITNLEPRTIHGESSEGMLLAATHKDKIVLLIPDKDILTGSHIS